MGSWLTPDSETKVPFIWGFSMNPWGKILLLKYNFRASGWLNPTLSLVQSQFFFVRWPEIPICSSKLHIHIYIYLTMIIILPDTMSLYYHMDDIYIYSYKTIYIYGDFHFQSWGIPIARLITISLYYYSMAYIVSNSSIFFLRKPRISIVVYYHRYNLTVYSICH